MANIDEMFRALEAADAAGASDDAREIAKMIQAAQVQPAVKPDTGFTGAFKGSTEELKANAYALLGRTGLMDTNAAEQQVKEHKARAAKIFQPTTEGWDEAPWMKIKELAGGSLPFMAAPAIAGAAAFLAPEVALAGGLITGADLAAGAAGIAQFTGSNLTRQMDENQRLAQTNLMAAGAAAVPQAALDTFGLRMIPGVRKIFGQAGVKISEKEAEGVAKSGLMSTLGSYAAQGVKTAGAEGLTEAGQQVFERLQAGLDLKDEAARKEYFDNFIGGAVLGGALSVPGHAFERLGGTQPAPVDTETGVTNIAPTANQGTATPVTQAGIAPVEQPPQTTFAPPIVATPPQGVAAPTAPVATPPVEAPPQGVAGVPIAGAPPVAPVQPVEAPVEPPAQATLPLGGGVEQNRNRGTMASISQMNKIAANPIYEFVGVDPKMTSGAPIVTGPVEIPAAQLGKKSTAIAENGTKVPVQYAVVDAGEVTPSNNVDGSANPAYTPEHPGLRSVVGNGRTAGLQASYARGLATEYRTKLTEDDTHGIDKSVIEGMQNPMLVRYAQPQEVPANIGDISNVAGTLALSTIDQAKNDANRVDLNALQFGNDGQVTRETIRGFVQGMPTTEQAQLIDSNGNNTRQAHDRLNAAIFHLAYGNDDLTHLAHQTDDEESRNLIRAMSESAPQMAQLANAGEYDIRHAVVEAAQVAINARRQGYKLSDFIKQQDMTANPLTADILKLFADNPRSSTAIAGSLKGLATKLNEEATAPTHDMFGERPRQTLQQILEKHFGKEAAPAVTKPAVPVVPATPEIRGYQIDKTKEQIHAEVSQIKNQVDLAKWAVDNAPNRFAKYIAEKVMQRLQEFQALGTPLNVEVLNGGRRPKGWYGRSDYYPQNGGRFNLRLRGLDSQGRADAQTGTRYSTILHELIHTATVPQFYLTGSYAKKYGKDVHPSFVEMGELLKIIKRQATKDGITDFEILKGLKNVDELIAHGLTSDKFQDYMAGIKVGPKTAYTKLIELIRKVLGIDPEYETALDRLMRATESSFAPSAAELAKDFAKAGTKFGTASRPDLVPSVQKDQTETPAFKRWSHGLPIYDSMEDNPGERGVYRVYHATRADFKEFIPGGLNPKDSGPATWLSPYADYQAAHFRTGNAASGFREGTNVMPLYARVASPLLIDDKDTLKWAQKVYGDSEFPQLLSQKTIDMLKEDGYDSILFKGEQLGWGEHANEIIVFSPTQMKSAIGNQGTFDPLSPSILEDSNVDHLTKLTATPTQGQAVRQAATQAWNNVQNSNYRTGLRVAWIDKNSGLTKSLESQPTFDTNGQLRADMLARTQDQVINLISNGLQTGTPTVNSDGTIGIERSENNLARSQIIADQLDGKVTLGGKRLSGREAVAEVARILRGKDILMEDSKRRALGAQQLAAAKELMAMIRVARDPENLNPETGKPYTLPELRAMFNGVKYMRREGTKNSAMRRELQVKQPQIEWAEAQLEQHPELGQVLDIWKNVNHSLVTLWEQVGLFTKQQADAYRSQDHYVPLFKSREDLENDPNGYGGTGAKSVKGIKKLQGSMATRNIWENVDKHYASMVASAYQNQTRKVATGQLKALGLAEIPEKSTDPRVNLRYRDPTDEFADKDGIVSAIISNPNDLAAFQMMHYELGPIMKIMAASTKMLRTGALLNPMYWIKQLVRDPIHATLVADSGIVTPFHSVKEYLNILANNSEEAKILASRGVIGQIDSTIDIHDFLKSVGTAKQDPNALQRGFHKIKQMHEASDAATRVAIYKNEYAAAKAKGMSEAHAVNYAVHKARESINFAVHGNSPTLNVLRNGVPFMSAAITSLDTVYRAATGYGKSADEKAAAQKMFYTRAAMMAVMCTAYAMAYQNDDDYKKLPDYVKDNNWLIPNPFGEGHSFIKIPVPFEVGFLFKTIPEAAVRYAYGTSTGREVLTSYAHGLASNLPGGSIPPVSMIPQAAKPILEVLTNYSFFTGRPIEGMADLGVPVAARGERASSLAKILSSSGLDSLRLSPVKIDYLIQAYMAELGTFSVGMASQAIDAAQGKTTPAKNVEEMPFNKAFMTNPNTSKAVADFYELEHNAQEAVTYFNRMKATGNTEGVKSFISEDQNKKQMAAAPVLRRIGTQMTELRKAMAYYKDNQNMDPELRRQKLNELETTYHKVASQGYKVAESAGLER